VFWSPRGSKFAVSHYFGYYLLQQLLLPYRPWCKVTPFELMTIPLLEHLSYLGARNNRIGWPVLCESVHISSCFDYLNDSYVYVMHLLVNALVEASVTSCIWSRSRVSWNVNFTHVLTIAESIGQLQTWVNYNRNELQLWSRTCSHCCTSYCIDTNRVNCNWGICCCNYNNFYCNLMCRIALQPLQTLLLELLLFTSEPIIN